MVAGHHPLLALVRAADFTAEIGLRRRGFPARSRIAGYCHAADLLHFRRLVVVATSRTARCKTCSDSPVTTACPRTGHRPARGRGRSPLCSSPRRRSLGTDRRGVHLPAACTAPCVRRGPRSPGAFAASTPTSSSRCSSSVARHGLRDHAMAGVAHRPDHRASFRRDGLTSCLGARADDLTTAVPPVSAQCRTFGHVTDDRRLAGPRCSRNRHTALPPTPTREHPGDDKQTARWPGANPAQPATRCPS